MPLSIFTSDLDHFINQAEVCRMRCQELIDRGSLIQPSELHYLRAALKELRDVGKTLQS